MIKICERTKWKLHVMKRLESESHCQPWKSHGVKTILENLLNCSLCSVYITVCIQRVTMMLNHEAMDSLQTPVSSSHIQWLAFSSMWQHYLIFFSCWLYRIESVNTSDMPNWTRQILGELEPLLAGGSILIFLNIRSITIK